MRESGEVAEPHVLIALDAEALPHRREHLGLLDRVDAQVGFQVEIEVEQITRVAGKPLDNIQNGLLHRVSRRSGRLGRRCRCRYCGGRYGRGRG